MTKQHFEAVARAIQRCHEDANGYKSVDAQVIADQTLNGVAERLADVFQSFNPNFNRATFIRACDPV